MAPEDKNAVAAEVWRHMFGFLIRTRPGRDAVLARLGLTPNEAKALDSLDADAGRPMRQLATEWRCDASTATWTVDRLERLGLAERRNHPRDRRVRLVVLTPKGADTKQALLRGMNATPTELFDLDLAELRALRDLLAKLPHDSTDAQPGPDGTDNPERPHHRAGQHAEGA